MERAGLQDAKTLDTLRSQGTGSKENTFALRSRCDSLCAMTTIDVARAMIAPAGVRVCAMTAANQSDFFFLKNHVSEKKIKGREKWSLGVLIRGKKTVYEK